MILNEYSKTTWVNGASPDINQANLNKLETGVYNVTEKARELAAYEVNAAASATAASASAVSAAASAAVYTDLAQDVTDLTTVVANHGTWSTTEEVVIGTYNGKPLYRKAVLIPALASAAGTTNYAHGIANIEKIMNGKNSHATNGITWIPIPFAYSSLADTIGVLATASNVGISVGQYRGNFSATIFLEYTKTTD